MNIQQLIQHIGGLLQSLQPVKDVSNAINLGSNFVNQTAFLRTSREFPVEAELLTVELNKAYIDTANNVNARTIGLFPSTRPAQGGESWFITANQKQQNMIGWI